MQDVARSDALVVVDVQNDFCPGGALAVAGGGEIVPVVNRLAARFANVVLTQDWHPKGHVSFASTHGRPPFETLDIDGRPQVLWPDHCVQGSAGADFHPGLDIPHAQAVLRKGHDVAMDSYSAFLEADRRTPTGLAGYLGERGIRRVFVAGLALDFCVGWTALDGRAAGLEVVVVEDACRAIDLDGSLARAFAQMQSAGVARAFAEKLAA